jgi:hypothetical protein
MGATILKNPPIGYENVFAGNFDITPSDRIEVSSENYMSIYVVDKWNGSQWIEGATNEQIAEYNRNIVPNEISRMKFIIQVYLTTGIMYEDIVLFIQNLSFDEAQKYVILTRLRSATHFDRYSNDLLTIAQMMGITSEQLDDIFINGNLLN